MITILSKDINKKNHAVSMTDESTRHQTQAAEVTLICAHICKHPDRNGTLPQGVPRIPVGSKIHHQGNTKRPPTWKQRWFETLGGLRLVCTLAGARYSVSQCLSTGPKLHWCTLVSQRALGTVSKSENRRAGRCQAARQSYERPYLA